MPSQRATSRASSAKTNFSYASMDEPGRKILYQGLEHNEERAGVSMPPPPWWHAVCCARASLCTCARVHSVAPADLPGHAQTC